jgi:23S rRNA (uracil1939-C5)-methyltransferase
VHLVPKGYKIFENLPVIGWHSSGKAIVSDGRHNIYVPYAIPGEQVDVTVAKRQKRNYIAGDLTSIVQASAHRVSPACPHFARCGGCNWMHIAYQQQLAFKKQLISQALAKYQIPHPPIEEVVPSPQPLAYRGKVDFAPGITPQSEIYWGYHPAEDPHTVFPVEECYITDPQVIATALHLQKVINAYHKSLPESVKLYEIIKGFTLRCNKNGDQLLTIHAVEVLPRVEELVNQITRYNPLLKSVFLKLQHPLHNTLMHLWGDSYLIESMNRWLFQLSADAFFQPNIHLADQLFQKIVSLASPSADDIIYDLYTGVGTIAIHLAPYAKHVIGIENSETAISDARANQLRNRLDNLSFVVGDVLKTFVPEFINLHGRPDIVVLDPPRSGTLIETLKNMIAFRPKRIVYVSCNPVSLAWNLTYLKDFYTIESVIPFDMFPQTHHVETLVRLERKSKENA